MVPPTEVQRDPKSGASVTQLWFTFNRFSTNEVVILHALDRRRTKGESGKMSQMDEGRKRVLAIVAGILVARHLKTAEDLFDSKPSPRTESMVAAAVQWADRITRKIDNVFAK